MERDRLLARARDRGVNPLVYWIARGILQPFFHLYFRMSRIGREHIPAEGGVILAANHRSFLDPFVIGCMVRRPCYFVAKKELFGNRFVAWILNSLGAFPIDRGNGDGDAMGTARRILERGDVVVIFPEGTRTRPGGLGRPKRGVARLALETGAPVVPVAVIGTESIRRGWRIRPHKVRIRAGRPLRFPQVESPSPQLAGAVLDRLWPMVALQWEWLGGMAPIRTVTVIGREGARLATALEQAGVAVSIGGDPAADLVLVAASPDTLPTVVAAHADRIGERSTVLVASKGLVAPLGTLPSAFVAERVAGRPVAALVGPADAPVVACADRATVERLRELLGRAGMVAAGTTDVVGAELAALAATAALGAGSPQAAGRIFADVHELGRRLGARPETFAGAAGVGELVAVRAIGALPDRDDEGLPPLLAYALQEHGVRRAA